MLHIIPELVHMDRAVEEYDEVEMGMTVNDVNKVARFFLWIREAG